MEQVILGKAAASSHRVMEQSALKFSEGSSVELMPYINTRARLTRMSDGKVLSAWVAPSYGDKLLLSISENTTLEPNEKFHIVLSCSTGSLDFESEFECLQGQRAIFSLPNQMELKAPIERMRRKVLNTSGLASLNEIEFPVKITDISRNGFGANSPLPCPKGAIIEIKLNTSHGIVTLQGKSMHVRFNEDLQMHVVGFEIASIDYENDVRWLKMVHAIE